MSLKDIALPLIRRGIRVVPARPGQRASTLEDWPNLATTNQAVIEEWDKQYPNWNLVCVAKLDDVAILDIDNLEAAYKLRMPKVPDTFTSQSPRPGFHVFFHHTARSRALGSRVVRNGVGTIVEFKDHNKTVCAPGCTRDDGGKYVVIDESPLIDFPDDLADWLERYAPKKATHDRVPVHEDFDFDEFCDFYDIEIVTGGPWYSPRYCPVKGDQHTKITDCAFYFDGEYLGWKDHAAECAGADMRIGALIKFLNEQKGESYPYPIWPERELDMTQFAGDDLAPQPGKPKLAFTEIFTNAVEVMPTIVPAKAEPKRSNLKYPQLLFPYEALPAGRLKDLVDKACEGGLSPGLVCPAILALASTLPHADVMEGARVNLYVCLLALVGAGKDTAIDRALAVLGMEDSPLYTAYSPSGERSISNLLGDRPPTKDNPSPTPGHRQHVIVTYELEDTLNKSRSETSSVLQALQWFYDHNRKTFSDSQKRTTQTVDCRLSWLTALPVGDTEIDEDTFRHAWGESSSHGMASRMLFGFAEERFDRRKSRNWTVPYTFNHWDIKETIETEGIGPVTREEHDSLLARLRKHKVTGFAPGVEDQYLAWHPKRDLSGRETYHILKLAVVVALVNSHSRIEQTDWDFVVALMQWEAEIRLAFAPGKAKKVDQGQFNETVVREVEKRTERLKASGTSTKHAKLVEQEGQMRYFVRWRAMANGNRWYRFGMNTEKTVATLVSDGTLAYLLELVPSADAKQDKLEVNKAWVRLVNPDRTPLT